MKKIIIKDGNGLVTEIIDIPETELTVIEGNKSYKATTHVWQANNNPDYSLPKPEKSTKKKNKTIDRKAHKYK